MSLEEIYREFEIVKTDERFETSLPPQRFFTRRGAQRSMERYPPSIPTWRWELEKKGWFRFELIPYQNKLVRRK